MLWSQAHWEQAWQPVGWGFFFRLTFVVGDISRGVGFLTGLTYSFIVQASGSLGALAVFFFFFGGGGGMVLPCL